MFRPTMRDAVWFAALVAMSLGWYFEYRQDALDRYRDSRTIQYLTQQLSEKPEPRILPIRLPIEPDDLRPSVLRPVPGNSDYQFPPELHKLLEPEPLIPWGAP